MKGSSSMYAAYSSSKCCEISSIGVLGFFCSLKILTVFCKVSLGADLELTAVLFSLQDCMWIFRKSLTVGECQSVRDFPWN